MEEQSSQGGSSLASIFDPISKITKANNDRDLLIIQNEALLFYTRREIDRIGKLTKEHKEANSKLVEYTEQIREANTSVDTSRKSLALKSDIIVDLKQKCHHMEEKLANRCNDCESTYNGFVEKYNKARKFYETHHPLYKQLKQYKSEYLKMEITIKMLKQQEKEALERNKKSCEMKNKIFYALYVNFAKTVLDNWKLQDLLQELHKKKMLKANLTQKLKDLEIRAEAKDRELQKNQVCSERITTPSSLKLSMYAANKPILDYSSAPSYSPNMSPRSAKQYDELYLSKIEARCAEGQQVWSQKRLFCSSRPNMRMQNAPFNLQGQKRFIPQLDTEKFKVPKIDMINSYMYSKTQHPHMNYQNPNVTSAMQSSSQELNYSYASYGPPSIDMPTTSYKAKAIENYTNDKVAVKHGFQRSASEQNIPLITTTRPFNIPNTETVIFAKPQMLPNPKFEETLNDSGKIKPSISEIVTSNNPHQKYMISSNSTPISSQEINFTFQTQTPVRTTSLDVSKMISNSKLSDNYTTTDTLHSQSTVVTFSEPNTTPITTSASIATTIVDGGMSSKPLMTPQQVGSVNYDNDTKLQASQDDYKSTEIVTRKDEEYTENSQIQSQVILSQPNILPISNEHQQRLSQEIPAKLTQHFQNNYNQSQPNLSSNNLEHKVVQDDPKKVTNPQQNVAYPSLFHELMKHKIASNQVQNEMPQPLPSDPSQNMIQQQPPQSHAITEPAQNTNSMLVENSPNNSTQITENCSGSSTFSQKCSGLTQILANMKNIHNTPTTERNQLQQIPPATTSTNSGVFSHFFAKPDAIETSKSNIVQPEPQSNPNTQANLYDSQALDSSYLHHQQGGPDTSYVDGEDGPQWLLSPMEQSVCEPTNDVLPQAQTDTFTFNFGQHQPPSTSYSMFGKPTSVFDFFAPP